MKFRFILLTALLVLYSASAWAGPITFNTALPIHSGEVIVRTQTIYAKKSNAPNNANLHVFTVPVAVVWGPTSKLAFFGIVPLQAKSFSLGGQPSTTEIGVADVSVFSRFTALSINGPGRTLRLAPFGGVVLPTGKRGDTPPLNLGQGGIDPFLGTIFTVQTLRWELDLSTKYRLTTNVDDVDRNDVVSANASFQYRVLPFGELNSGVPNWLFAVLETNTQWSIETGDQPSSSLVFVSPGLQWITRRTVVEGSVQIPIVDTNSALETDIIARLSLRLNF